MQETAAPATDSREARLSQAEYGSDLVVELIRSLEIPYVSLNPGASYRGIHDSFVNFAGGGPEMIVCCHEEIAVAVAAGYARATGKPMVAAIHDVVGLQHATMAVYHAWCARLPMIIVGGTGPMAAENRRPGTDWTHTALVQGNQIRDYVKWDDQPASPLSIPESIMRAHKIATTEPMGPVYLCFDTDLQEQAITAPISLPDPKRYAPPAPMAPNPDALKEAAALLAEAQWPVIVAGSVARHPEALGPLAELAELLAAPVISTGYSLPTSHPLNATSIRQEALRDADVVLALDVFDLAGAFSQTGGIKDRGSFPQYIKPETKIIHIHMWDLLQHSWATEFQKLSPVDVPIAADTQLAIPLLLEACGRALAQDGDSGRRIDDRRQAIEQMQGIARERRAANARRGWDSRPISLGRMNAELWEAVKGKPWMVGNARPGFEIIEPDQVVGRAGQCIHQPFDDVAHPEANFKDRIKLHAYPVEARGGLLWVYMGPAPAPLVPDWDMFYRDGMIQLVFTEVPCNWVQCQENSIDPVHFEWLHSYWSYDLAGRTGQPAPPHLKVGFDEFEYGFVYRRIQEGMTEDNPLWIIGRTCLWPNALYTGDHCEWRVPIDDGHTLSVGWFLDVPAPGHELPGGKQYFHWNSPLTDAETGRWINSHTMNQDFIAWVGQGAAADRTKEHLSPSDRGVIMMRQRLFEEMDVVSEGGDPKATFRDPAANDAVKLPYPGTRTGPNPRPDRFPFLAGMPPEVEKVFRQVKASWNRDGGQQPGRPARAPQGVTQ